MLFPPNLSVNYKFFFFFSSFFCFSFCFFASFFSFILFFLLLFLALSIPLSLSRSLSLPPIFIDMHLPTRGLPKNQHSTFCEQEKRAMKCFTLMLNAFIYYRNLHLNCTIIRSVRIMKSLSQCENAIRSWMAKYWYKIVISRARVETS